MTPEDAAGATAENIVALGGAFMLHRPTLKKGPELGFPKGWPFYFAGRGGALGDVAPDVVAATFVFFSPPFVHQQWLLGRAVMEPSAAAAAYAEACQDWGRLKFDGYGELDRLVELLQRLAAGADVAAAPLFAGWRALPLPDDSAGAAAQLFQVLREFRGAMHQIAVLSTGLTPVEAVIASGGEANAEFNGWPRPYPDREPLVDLHIEAEELTDTLTAPAYEALDDDERDELVALVSGAHAHAFNLAV
jgi:hypothetical protein